MAGNKANRNAAVIIGGIFLLSLLALLFFRGDSGSRAEISIDGKLVMTVELSQDDEDISLSDFDKNVGLRIKNHQIAFLDSDCPNKTCVAIGFIHRKGQTAVCLPNRVAITIR